MRAEYLNIFTKSVSSILHEMVCETPEMGKLSTGREFTCRAGDVAICFNITGALNGRVVLTAGQDCILRIVEKMVQERIDNLDDLARSAIGELGNMIVANATIGLADCGYTCDITPPLMVLGRSAPLPNGSEMRTLVIPFKLSAGEVNVNISLSEKTN